MNQKYDIVQRITPKPAKYSLQRNQVKGFPVDHHNTHDIHRNSSDSMDLQFHKHSQDHQSATLWDAIHVMFFPINPRSPRTPKENIIGTEDVSKRSSNQCYTTISCEQATPTA